MMYGKEPIPPAPMPIIILTERKNVISCDIASKIEPTIKKESVTKKAFLLPIRSATFVHKGIEIDIPSRKIAIIQPIN
ncbi:Uncharacterised protein [Chlamydia trachomatis]|nr:Uncharacterised protein [Chlamydia trachomatis]